MEMRAGMQTQLQDIYIWGAQPLQVLPWLPLGSS